MKWADGTSSKTWTERTLLACRAKGEALSIALAQFAHNICKGSNFLLLSTRQLWISGCSSSASTLWDVARCTGWEPIGTPPPSAHWIWGWRVPNTLRSRRLQTRMLAQTFLWSTSIPAVKKEPIIAACECGDATGLYDDERPWKIKNHAWPHWSAARAHPQATAKCTQQNLSTHACLGWVPSYFVLLLICRSPDHSLKTISRPNASQWGSQDVKRTC